MFKRSIFLVTFMYWATVHRIRCWKAGWF